MVKLTKTVTKFVIAGLICFSLFACAPTVNPNKNMANSQGKVAGFVNGIWDGSIMPISFVVSLFNKKISIYETHNNGNWYNFGFLLGVGGGLGIKFNVWGSKQVISLNIFSFKNQNIEP